MTTYGLARKQMGGTHPTEGAQHHCESEQALKSHSVQMSAMSHKKL